jgi:hypothetical protein
MADNVFRTEITAERAQFDAQMDAVADKSITVSQRMQSAFREASVQVGDAVKHTNDSLNRQFDTIKAGVEKVRGVMAAAIALVGGGSLFGKWISESAAATAETAKLARMLGTTTQEATALRVALDDIGSDTDTYVGALGKMTMHLREGEERFNQLGVTTRSANGELLDGATIMQNGLQALQNFKAGTDRNLAATELFGKGWAEVSKLLRLTPEVMEESRKKAEELQITVGPLGAERAREYKRAMQDVHDVVEAVGNRVAQAVMPALTDMAQWLAEIGPGAVTVMRGAIGGLMTAFYALQNGIVVVVRTISMVLFTIIEPLAGIAEAIYLSLTGKFGAAADRLKQIPANISSHWTSEFDEILKSGDKTRERIAALFDFSAEQGSGDGGARKGTRSYTGKDTKDDKDKSRMSGWETELAAQRDAYERMKLEQGSFEEFSKQRESAFWKELLSLQDLTAEERAAVSRKYYAVEREIRKEAFEREQADIKAQIDAHKQGSQERIQLAEQNARTVGEKYGLESKHYRDAQAEIAKYQREAMERAKQLQEIELESFKQHQLQRVELERTNLETMERLGVITGQQKLMMLKQLKELELQIEVQAREEKLEGQKSDVAAYRRTLEEIEQLKRKHSVDVAKIDGQIAEQQRKDLEKWFDPVASAAEKMATGIIMGTQRWRDAVRRALVSLGAEYLSLGVKILMNWVKTEVLKTQATVAGVTARTAAETAGSSQSIITTAGSAIANIGAKAWEAAASVYASIAQIPYVGPFLAPVMAIAAAGMVLGFIGKIASAAGGFDVPAGMSPMTQLHEEEMVLPKHIANPLRESLESGGGAGGGGSLHVTIHAVDGASIERLIRNNSGAFARGLGSIARNFATKTGKS